ncbi:hypothetical protein A2307_00665 [Candidatus Peregrinibacteria bacterium RIFOXYB2_FULL_33_20]|nr:MAG: hypothetical protein A2307_00665 [Candidatus Peregrinibacteria bacterium RIFOXYB2_FULL_33_20]
MFQTCKNCGESFEITDVDLKFYDKISPVFNDKKYQIPAPTLCPSCRRQRRFTFRNERNLYYRKCSKTGKQLISNLNQDTGIKIYENEFWWSDKWDASEYGREFNFNESFFNQFKKLYQDVPQLALSVWFSENSNFCNYAGNVKNSYLIFGSVYSEDCFYGSPYYSKNCVDTLLVRECEFCYECTDCRKLYQSFYCQDCTNCNNLIYCYDLQSCSDCIGCVGLRNKKNCIFNQQFSKEEFQKMKNELNLCIKKSHEIIKEKLNELKLRVPHKYMQSNQVENVSGNYVYESKNIKDSYYTDKSQDCAYCTQVVNLKDCYDNNYTEENELCCEYISSYQNSRLLFTKFCNRVHEAMYCDSCYSSKNLFGCVGLKNKQYCILNKQYSKEEYEKLVPKIIESMQSPHPPLSRGRSDSPLDKGDLGDLSLQSEWGEFFPSSISPFCYNETVAQEYFPLTKEQALSKGYKWKDEDLSSQHQGPEYQIPEDIKDVKDEICDSILKCEATSKLYKIIPQELKFYRQMNLPIPKKCPDIRHQKRLALRNPRKLFDRNCMKCGEKIKTTYAPDRPEIVYCEKCYLENVY